MRSPNFDRAHISLRTCDDVDVVNDDDLIARLRALSNQPVDDRVAHAHLAGATAAAVDPGRRRRALLAACIGALIVPAAGIVAARSSGSDGDPVGVVDQPVVTDQFACTGPPPTLGQAGDGADAEQAVARNAQAREFAEWRAINCPSSDTTSSIAVDPTSTMATTTTAAVTTTTLAMTTTEAMATTSAALPAAANGAPANPPDDVPADPRADGVPARSEDAPAGPPDGVPGPPDGVPAGPPDGVPGPPDGVPTGPPDDVPGQGGGRTG